MSIKYYRLAKDEEPPEEFCAVRDVNGEPSEYTWYERVSEFDRDLWVPFTQSDWFAGSEYRKLQAENAKLRAVIESEIHCWKGSCNGCVAYRPAEDGWCDQQVWLEELGIEGHL